MGCSTLHILLLSPLLLHEESFPLHNFLHARHLHYANVLLPLHLHSNQHLILGNRMHIYLCIYPRLWSQKSRQSILFLHRYKSMYRHLDESLYLEYHSASNQNVGIRLLLHRDNLSLPPLLNDIVRLNQTILFWGLMETHLSSYQNILVLLRCP